MTEELFAALMYWWSVGFGFGVMIHVSAWSTGGVLQWLKEMSP